MHGAWAVCGIKGARGRPPPYYIAGIFHSRRRGAALVGLLALVYGYKYVTLRSEDHALLLDALLLFGVLAGAMIVTRRFDWYAVGGRLTGNRTAGSESREINQS